MALDDFSFTPEEAHARLSILFEAAKSADEFEFGCTLLRVRGLEDVGWDPFVETSPDARGRADRGSDDLGRRDRLEFDGPRA